MSTTDNQGSNQGEEESCPKCGYKGPPASLEQHKCEGANSEIT